MQRHADGKLRCAWCGIDPLYIQYHDNEWGVPVHDDRRLFEMLCLEGAQAGLSWLTILRKRETYRLAFDDFDAEAMARYGAAKRKRLLQHPGIVRNRLKIDAFITQRPRLLKNSRPAGRLRRLHLAIHRRTGAAAAGRCTSRISPHRPSYSDAMSKELKQNGFRFVGSTICYAFMQAVGIVDEHQRNCWVTKQRRKF